MSSQALLIGLGLVVILSVVARVFGGWAGIPVIVPLLAIGVIAGESVAGIVEPSKLLGDTFPPFVQIVVALILFEGALGLRFDQFPREVRPAVLRLVTIGVLVTWALGALGTKLFLDLPTSISILIGAIVIVSGPTVVLPLLSFIRPPDRVRATLKWEGVLMDPLGAIIAVVVFAAISSKNGATVFSAEEFVLSIVVGLASGLAFAVLLVIILGSRKLSGRDKVAATLMMVVASFLVAELAYQDAGLAAALVMGIALANQKKVTVTYIDEFKETLIPILLGILFVLLAASIDIGAVFDLGLPGLALVAFLSFIVRPLDVLTTIGLPIPWKERLFMMSISARGIVAAATAPTFGLVLVARGVDGADKIVPAVFLIIAGTVIISSVLGPASARLLGLAGKSDPAMFVVGGARWAIALGQALVKAGVDTRFWTVDPKDAKEIEDAGLSVSTDPLDPRDPDRITGLNGVSLVAVTTPNALLNQFLAYDLSEVLEPDQVYRLPYAKGSLIAVENAGRPIKAEIGFDEMDARVEGGQKFQVFGSDEKLPDGAVPLVVIETNRRMEKAKVFFYCDRPDSPERKVRRVAALVPA